MKGASLRTLCWANTTIFRSSADTWYPPAVRVKNRVSRSGLIPARAASGYTPDPAVSSDARWASVAKIFTGTGRGSASAASRTRTASEYASSPVAHPATHSRNSSPAGSRPSRAGRTSRPIRANASSSRKNRVTPISKSLYSRFSSAGSSASRRAYASSPGVSLSPSRRSSRRATVSGL